MKIIYTIFGFILVSLISLVPLQAKEAITKSEVLSLGDLLKKVQTGWKIENSDNIKRETDFINTKNKQEYLLKQAKADLVNLQKQSDKLEWQFNDNEGRITELEETLRLKLGTMGELFGVIRQVAGTTRGLLNTSLVSSQYPSRGDSLESLANSKNLPELKQLEELWYVLTHEMTESGKVSRYNTKVIKADGEEKNMNVLRIGTFNAISDGKYLKWMPVVGKLNVLSRQPASRYMSAAKRMEQANNGLVKMAIDPSRGSLLSLLVQTPSFEERIHFGGLVGYIIIGLGILAFLLSIFRILYLVYVKLMVKVQQKSNTAKSNNPLGRIMKVYSENSNVDIETLELKLDEAIITETSKLERFQWAVKVISAAAPLLGLLGTVTGMIQTFQAITLFGTGDPKLMAGGISEALVTTMLGLMVAIPLVLLHSWLGSISKDLIYILRRESTGITADLAEKNMLTKEKSNVPATA